MKCPKCDGYGKVTYIVRSGNRIISKEVGECDYCYGTGEVNDWETESTEEPMTNEEWLRTCSTEELAEFLIVSIKNCKSCASGIGADEVADCPFGECGCHFKSEVIKWLKQPHKENE